MARNYTTQVMEMMRRTEKVDGLLDALGQVDTSLFAKWNAMDNIVNDAETSELVMLAFAAGRNFENARIAAEVNKLF